MQGANVTYGTFRFSFVTSFRFLFYRSTRENGLLQQLTFIWNSFKFELLKASLSRSK